MEFTPREEQIYLRTVKSTHDFILNLDFDELNTDAFNLSLDLDIDRSNVSRILNQLHRENYLIKVQGRPTLFLARSIILDNSNLSYVSSIITEKEDFLRSIHSTFHDDGIENTLEHKDTIVGFRDNESMSDQSYIVSAMTSYPNHLYNIDVLGEPSTGKDSIIKYIHSSGYRLKKYSHELYEFNALEFSTSLNDTVELINKISSINNKNKTSLIVIKQTYRLKPSTLSYLMSQLRLIQLDENQTPKQFIFLEDQIENEVQRKIISPYTTNTLLIPSIDNRTMKEKVEFFLVFFQNESIAINRPIYLNKNILSCFAMSTYFNNLKQIENEIRYSVSKAVYREKSDSHAVVELEFDDLSDRLLDSIENVTNRLIELNNIFDFLNQSDFYFIPNVLSKELSSLRNSVLDHDNRIIDATLSLSPLSTYVKKDIQTSMETELNIIRALNVKEIYNIIYPLFTSDDSYDDRDLYLLFVHLESVVNDIKRKSYKQKYFNDTAYKRPEIIALAQKIFTTVENEYKVALPNIELNYIQSYLTQARFNPIAGNIPILLVSHSKEIADSYKNYVYSINMKSEIQTFHYKPDVLKDHMNLFLSSLKKEVSSLNQGRGVIIITDVTSITSIMQEVFHDSNHKVVVISPLSLDTVIKSCTLAEKPGSIIEDFHSLNTSVQIPSTNTLENGTDYTSNFIHDISIRILSESLVFLDVNKSNALLSAVLMNIYKSLDFEYSDSLSIRFIHHTSFMIERIIRNEALSYRNINGFIKKFPNIYKVVEEEFQIINNQFGITVPASELVMISEIFVNVIDQ